ncbi:MAG: hypothetical protein ACPGXK_12220, partial [Phycisphaerae bacterium]
GGGSGTTDDGDTATDDIQFMICTAEDPADVGVDFGEPGFARVVASSLGAGRHLVATEQATFQFEFDKPIRACSVISQNISMRNMTTDTDVQLSDEQLSREHILDEQGTVTGSRVSVVLPADLEIGHDFEIILDTETMGIDGEFRESNGGTLANGVLPSGDENPGGDFVQQFRLVSLIDYLVDTQGASGLALDQTDRLVLVSRDNGVWGPFTSDGEVAEDDRIGGELGPLSPRAVTIDSDGQIVVKDATTDNQLWMIDPSTGNASILATTATAAEIDDLLAAPDGFQSAERAGVEVGDFLYTSRGSIVVQDLRAAAGTKGELALVDADESSAGAYVNLFEPEPKSGEVYGGWQGENGRGFVIHRVGSNGVVDPSIMPTQNALTGVRGTAVLRLANIDGREEYLIAGSIDLDAANTGQILPADFDGRALMIYDATRDRLSVLSPLAIDEFSFSERGMTTDLAIESGRDSAFVSIPTQNHVVRLSGLANTGSSVTPVCDASVDDARASELADGSARVIASTLGNGKFLFQGSPTVVMFDFDQVIPACSADAIHITLRDETNDREVSLLERRIRRFVFASDDDDARSRLVIDLPVGLDAGVRYSLTLNAGVFGLDGDFGVDGENGMLPSGNGSPGGDFVQYFQLLTADYFLTETDGAAGVDVDGDDQLFAATASEIFGPFTSPTTPGGVLRTISLGDGQEIAGAANDTAGKPMVANQNSDDFAIAFAAGDSGELRSADRTAGIASLIAAADGPDAVSAAEVDIIESPTGYPGDYILINGERGLVVDTSAMQTEVLFERTDEQLTFASISSWPTSSFSAGVLVAVNDLADNSVSALQIAPNGVAETLFEQQGATCEAVIRLPDSANGMEFLMLCELATGSDNLETNQVLSRQSGTGLLWIRPAENRLQVIGTFSRGSDMAFSESLDTIYTAHPALRAVLRIEGF